MQPRPIAETLRPLLPSSCSVMALPFLGAIKGSVIVGRSDLHPAKDCRHHRFGIGVVEGAVAHKVAPRVSQAVEECAKMSCQDSSVSPLAWLSSFLRPSSTEGFHHARGV